MTETPRIHLPCPLLLGWLLAPLAAAQSPSLVPRVSEPRVERHADACAMGGCRGHWDEAYDWGLLTCSGGDYDDPEHPCHTANCTGLPWGEIPHAQLFLQNPSEYLAAPDRVTPNWRVLLVDTGSFDTPAQDWYLWDPDQPTELILGSPRVPQTLFCAGHTALADGRLLFAGGQRWPGSSHGSCLPWGSFTAFVYDPEAGAPLDQGPGRWVQLDHMRSPRYYPTPVLLPEGKVMVIAGDSQPPSFEVYDPKTNRWEDGEFPFTNKPCPSIYPSAHLLPAIDPSISRGTVLSTGPFLLDQIDPPFLCGGQPDTVGLQRTFLPVEGFATEPFWGSNPAPATELNRAESSSVLIVDTRTQPAKSRVVFGAGMETAFFGEVYDSVEMIVDGQSLTPTAVPLPSLKHPRFYQLFVLLPGERILALGGDSGGGLSPGVMHPEVLDLNDLEAGWQVLPPHDHERVYHSWGLLLPDGSVLHGGGRNLDDSVPYRHAQRFSPAYNADPILAEMRPELAPAPSVGWAYGESVSVSLDAVGSGIASFELIRPGASTHASDFDQRLVLLSFADEGAGSFRVDMPATADLAPPGWYMLFAVSTDGVPSEGRWIRLQRRSEEPLPVREVVRDAR